jgi:hypothetical protein
MTTEERRIIEIALNGLKRRKEFFKSIIEKDGEIAVRYFFFGGVIVLLYTIRGMKGISIEISDTESNELTEIINRKIKEFRALYSL